MNYKSLARAVEVRAQLARMLAYDDDDEDDDDVEMIYFTVLNTIVILLCRSPLSSLPTSLSLSLSCRLYYILHLLTVGGLKFLS